MTNRPFRRLVPVALALLVALGTVLAMAAQGDEGDPLITLGYLTQQFRPQVEAKISDAVVAAREAHTTSLTALADGYLAEMDGRLARSDGGVSFVTVTLSAGQTLSGGAGLEVVLRSGGAVASGGLTDTTEGAAVASGTALAVSHLYVSDAAGAVLTTAAQASVMVRGDYTVQ